MVDQSNDSVTLTWILASFPDTYNISYVFRELAGSLPQMGTNFTEIGSGDYSIDAGTVTYIFSPLLPYTEYNITVSVVYDSVESVPSPTVVTQTEEGGTCMSTHSKTFIIACSIYACIIQCKSFWNLCTVYTGLNYKTMHLWCLCRS